MTCEEIKAYVKEHIELRASIYILCRRKEYGVIERKNYNQAKLGDKTI